MYRRVDIAEVPLIGGQSAIRLHVPFPRHQVQLLLCESRVHHGKRNTMKCRIPSERAMNSSVRHPDLKLLGRAHVANHGYSHLSGMERMSLMYMCFHS